MEGKPDNTERGPAAPDVRLDLGSSELGGQGKYILAEVVHPSGEKHTTLRADSSCTQHYQIAEKLKVEYPDAEIKVLGGGFLAYFGPEIGNEIEVFDVSTKYGKEDREVTKQLLAEAFPDRTITELPTSTQ